MYLKNSITYVFVLLPLLGLYATPIPSISVAELIMIVFGGVYISMGKKIVFLKCYSVYLVFFVLLMFLSVFRGMGDFFIISHRLASFLLFFFVVTVVVSALEVDKAISLLKKTSSLVSIFFLFQYIFHLITGVKTQGLLPYLPLSNNQENSVFREHLLGMDRFSSFFDEPSHFVQYVGLGLLLYLFCSDGKSRMQVIPIFIITISMLLSKSGNAIIILLVVYGYYLLNKIKNNYKYLMPYFFAVFLVCYVFLQTEVYSSLISRVSEISGESASISGYVRILRGYEIFLDFTLDNKLFGISGINMEYYYSLYPAKDNGLVTEGLIEYMNAVHFHLVYFGGVGFLFLILFYYNVFSKGDVRVKAVMLLLIALSLVESIINNPMWVLYIGLAMSLINRYKGFKYEKKTAT